MTYGTGFNAECKEMPIAEIPSYIKSMGMTNDLPCDAGTDYVARKEDMTYEELCTLEGMVALFNHDESLDMEIANLKEKCLLKTIHDLESKFKAIEDEYTSMLFNNDNKKASERMMDALMLMTYIDTDDIPKAESIDIIKAAAKKPSILLNFIYDDVIVAWPVSKRTDDGKYVEISNGLKTEHDDYEDVLMRVHEEMEDVYHGTC